MTKSAIDQLIQLYDQKIRDPRGPRPLEPLMFARLGIAILICSLWSCATRKAKSGFEDIADFGLSGDESGVKIDDKAYFDDLKRSESSVSFDSSLPLPFRVGKSGDPFDTIPKLAQPSLESRLNVTMGPCVFTILSGPVQVDRYLLADKWIKLTEGLPSKTPVKLEPNQDLNIKAVTKMAIEVSESMTPVCRRLFEGRKVFIGRFHLNKSRLGLISGTNSPQAAFTARSLDPQGKMVYLHWQSGSSVPTLIDDFDFPATAESGIFRAQMGNKGYYYLAFQTVLRMDKVDSMVIKLPYNGPVPTASPATNPAPVANVPGVSAPQTARPMFPANNGSSSSTPAPAPAQKAVNTMPAKAPVKTKPSGVPAKISSPVPAKVTSPAAAKSSKLMSPSIPTKKGPPLSSPPKLKKK